MCVDSKLHKTHHTLSISLCFSSISFPMTELVLGVVFCSGAGDRMPAAFPIVYRWELPSY